jgi:hypothetical protein
MNRTVLLIVTASAIMAGCGQREDAARAPETAASPPTAATEPAHAGPEAADPVPADAAPAEAPPSVSDPAAPADAPVAEETAVGANGCNTDAVQHLVGEIYTPEAGEQARIAAGARIERALRPGQIVTMEFRADRLSFTLDEKGRISRVTCG